MEQSKQYEYVDLGLPSGLKWAKCNVGAEKETDYGYYFQWGETEPHDVDTPYDWANYKYSDDFYNTLTKYNYTTSYGEDPDGKTTLELEDDAARANMGGNWRMPRPSEFRELLVCPINEWVEDFNGSGVSGRKFTSKTDESKYIFIPASGYRFGSSLYFQGGGGGIWSSSLYTAVPYSACFLSFSSDNFNADNNIGRFHGFVVRGVMD